MEQADGSVMSSAFAVVRDADAVCRDGPSLARAEDGTIAPLIALSDAEVAENATRTDGKQLWLEATGGFVYDAVAYVFYEHHDGAGLLDAASRGTGLCVVPAIGSPCTRVVREGDTVLWPAGTRFLDQSGIVADGRALVYGCRQVATLSKVCTVTGAPLERLDDPRAYEVYSFTSGWNDDPFNGTLITDELGPITVSFYRGVYLLTTLDVFDQRVYVRRAPTPTEEFDRRIELFAIVPTEAAFPDGGREHAGLRRQTHEIHVSYGVFRAQKAELHLATFEFYGDRTGDSYQRGVP
jgi:hypothetical protein